MKSRGECLEEGTRQQEKECYPPQHAFVELHFLL